MNTGKSEGTQLRRYRERHLLKEQNICTILDLCLLEGFRVVEKVFSNSSYFWDIYKKATYFPTLSNFWPLTIHKHFFCKSESRMRIFQNN